MATRSLDVVILGGGNAGMGDSAPLSRRLGGSAGWQHDGFRSVGFFNVR
jgi:hypothetical protein